MSTYSPGDRLTRSHDGLEMVVSLGPLMSRPYDNSPRPSGAERIPVETPRTDFYSPGSALPGASAYIWSTEIEDGTWIHTPMEGESHD